jgi:hypothetical protein
MKYLLFHLKAVKTGTLKAQVGAGAETFWKSESEPERKKIVSAPQPCLPVPITRNIRTGCKFCFCSGSDGWSSHHSATSDPAWKSGFNSWHVWGHVPSPSAHQSDITTGTCTPSIFFLNKILIDILVTKYWKYRYPGTYQYRYLPRYFIYLDILITASHPEQHQFFFFLFQVGCQREFIFLRPSVQVALSPPRLMMNCPVQVTSNMSQPCITICLLLAQIFRPCLAVWLRFRFGSGLWASSDSDPDSTTNLLNLCPSIHLHTKLIWITKKIIFFLLKYL